MSKIIFNTDKVSIQADLNDTEVSRQIAENLPLSAEVNTWGEEIYFRIPTLNVSAENGTTDVNVGDVAFWPEGNCLCVFFGRTPVSTSEKPVPASKVLPVGTVSEGLEKLGSIADGENITVTKE